jgi:GTP-binding protein EngB required for normal cell division/uncharacterized protein YukE
MPEPTTASPAKNSTDWKAVAATACTRVRDLCEEENEADFVEQLARAERRLQLGIFRLVVMGEIKKGKSSFINALLGEKEIVPTASDVATSTVFKILYASEKQIKVFFRPDVDTGKRQPYGLISPGEIPDYGTEKGNPNNSKSVDFIGIELPNPILKSGLVIVDTPGVGGLFRQHRDITWQYAPKADAICFILDSAAAVISAQEIEFLQDLVKKISRRIFFVQTKIDTVDEEQWKSWEVRNKSILVEKLGIPEDKLLYFTVSSKLKHDADESQDAFDLTTSGFLPLLDFLHQGLLRSKDLELAKDAAREIRGVVSQVATSVSQRRQIFSTESKEKLGEIQTKLAEAKEELRDWRQATLQSVLRTFGDKLSELKRQGETRLQEDLDPDGTYVANVLDRVRDSPELNASEIKERAGMITMQCVDDLSEVVMDVQGEFNHGFQKLLDETLITLASGLSDQVPALSDQLLTGPTSGLDFAVNPNAPLNVELSGKLGSIRGGFMGLGSGSAIAYVGVSLLGLAFPPILAIASIAPILGGLFVGGWSIVDQNKKERAQVLDRLRSEIGRVVRQVQRKALLQFRDTTDKLERKSRDCIDATVKRIQTQLETQMSELSQAGKMTAEESREKVKAADEQLEKIKRFAKPLEALLVRGVAP